VQNLPTSLQKAYVEIGKWALSTYLASITITIIIIIIRRRRRRAGQSFEDI